MRSVALFLAAATALSFVSTSYGLTAIKNGKTSTKPTSTNPQIYQCQLATDPIGVTEFQITQQFDASRVNIDTLISQLSTRVRGVNGYALGPLASEGTVPLSEKVRVSTQGNLGLITVRGYWPLAANTVPQEEIDVFVVDYPLYAPGVNNAPDPREVALPFATIGLNFNSSLFPQADFIRTVDIDDGAVIGTGFFTNDGGTENQIDSSFTAFDLLDAYVSVLGDTAASRPGITPQFHVPFSAASGYTQLVVPVPTDLSDQGAFTFDFAGPNPGEVIVALDLEGTSVEIAALVARLGLRPIDPAANDFGPGFDAYLRVPAGTSSFYTLDFGLLDTPVSLNRFAVIPEPANLGLFALAVPALVSRRRR